jgi:hypothetical protein
MQTIVRRMNIVRTCLIATLLAVSAGCNLQPRDVWVYVDNAGQRPLVVTVDDQLAATIAAGEVTKLSFPPGEHRFHIASGDEVVCDLVRNLEPSKQIGVCRKYLFNPAPSKTSC